MQTADREPSLVRWRGAAYAHSWFECHSRKASSMVSTSYFATTLTIVPRPLTRSRGKWKLSRAQEMTLQVCTLFRRCVFSLAILPLLITNLSTLRNKTRSQNRYELRQLHELGKLFLYHRYILSSVMFIYHELHKTRDLPTQSTSEIFCD